MSSLKTWDEMWLDGFKQPTPPTPAPSTVRPTSNSAPYEMPRADRVAVRDRGAEIARYEARIKQIEGELAERQALLADLRARVTELGDTGGRAGYVKIATEPSKSVKK